MDDFTKFWLQHDNFIHHCMDIAGIDYAIRKDAEQDVFIKCWLNYRKDGKPLAFIRKVIFNYAIDNLRKKKVLQYGRASIAPQITIDREIIETNLKRITGTHYAIVELLQQGYSIDEIAAKLNTPRGTISNRLFDIRNAAAKLINQHRRQLRSHRAGNNTGSTG